MSRLPPMVSFENFVKSMPPNLSELKVTPSFCFPFKIPDDPTATTVYKKTVKYGNFYIFFFLICSISRKPIRSKGGRQSSMSIHSVTTVSSEEGINAAISVVSVSGQVGVSVEPDMQRVKVPGIEAKQPVPSKVQTLLRATPDFQSPTFRRHSNV